MRILILHSRYRSGPASGENRVVADEARLLKQGGHNVEVFAPSTSPRSAVELLKAGSGVIWSRQAVTEVRSRLRRFRPDIVHLHNLFPALSPAVIRECTGRVPVVMTLHNYRLHCLPGVFFRDGKVCEDCLGRVPWPGIVHRCYQGSASASIALASSLMIHRSLGTFRQVSLYLAISEFVRTKIVRGGVAPERIVVKPHFTWPSKLRSRPGDYFLFLGRLSPEKGIGLLVKAWSNIDAKLLVVGSGPQELSIRTSSPRTVEFLPTVSPVKAQELIRGARAMVVPSVSYEAAGRVVLEGYSAGVPALASRIGGLPELVVDGKTGLLIPPGDPEAWRRGVERLLVDEETHNMGQASLSLWREKYGPEAALRLLEAAYHRVCK